MIYTERVLAMLNFNSSSFGSLLLYAVIIIIIIIIIVVIIYFRWDSASPPPHPLDRTALIERREKVREQPSGVQ